MIEAAGAVAQRSSRTVEAFDDRAGLQNVLKSLSVPLDRVVVGLKVQLSCVDALHIIISCLHQFDDRRPVETGRTDCSHHLDAGSRREVDSSLRQRSWTFSPKWTKKAKSK